MASTTCGYCARLAHMKAASGLHIIAGLGYGGSVVKQAAYQCPNCLHLNLATDYTNDRGQSAVLSHGDAEEARWFDPTWLPRLGETQRFDDVPEHIGSAATEATLCLSVGAYRAVGSLARAVIEATAKDKGALGKNLEARIDALHAADRIRTHTKEQAHEIRHFGNDMAHGDFTDPVTKEEAQEIIALMAEVLDEVYQSPARLLRRKTARQAKKDQAKNT